MAPTATGSSSQASSSKASTSKMGAASPSSAPSAAAPPVHRNFASLHLSPALLRALSHLALTVPTPIQSLTIPTILSGSDLIGGSPTGTGKTLCFALPILHSLVQDPVGGHSLILTPTRELALQLYEQFLALAQGARMGIKISLVLGGMDMMKQATELAHGRPHIVVATPGRLWDLLRSGGQQEWGLDRCKFLVLDEADRLLTQTFAEALNYIMGVLPSSEKRQTLLFSATLTKEIEVLAEKRLAEAKEGKGRGIKVEKIEFDAKTPKNLRQRYIFVPTHVREVYLYHLLTHPPSDRRSHRVGGSKRKALSGAVESLIEGEQGDEEDFGTQVGEEEDEDEEERVPPTIIFVSRCQSAELLTRTLRELSLPAISLHSHLSQPTRLANLQKFRRDPARHILVATDVASRGLDIPQVEMVINFDLPLAWEDYLHRVGRTARAGKVGWALSFVGERDVTVLQGTEAKIGLQLRELEFPEERVLRMLGSVGSAKRVASMEMADGGFGEKERRNKEK
ncbi:DEAD-domain-containing protein, partial [Microstroma glucosiphilum]